MIYKTLHRKAKNDQQEPTKNRGWMEVLSVVLLFCHKSGDKSWMKKGPDCDYDKRNTSVVICETDIS